MLIEWAIDARPIDPAEAERSESAASTAGDGESVKFCHRANMNYVSASPFRVPIARLAAAQAVIEERAAKKAGKRGK